MFSKGDIVLLPHQKTMFEEHFIDGEDLVCIKNKLITAILRNGKIEPINGFIRVRKCVNDHVRDTDGKIALYMTDNHIEDTGWVEIVEVGDSETIPEQCVGWFCQCPEQDDGLQRIGYTKDYLLKEDLIEFIASGD